MPPKTLKLFGSRKKLIDNTKNGENIWSPEVVEVVSVQCNLVDKQYQQKLFQQISEKNIGYCYKNIPRQALKTASKK